MMAYSPEGQRLVSRKALSHGGSRERSGRGEFFTRSRMIGTTFLNLSNADAASKSQKPHFTSRQSCGGYRVKKLGASPSSRPLRRPAAAPPLPCRCPFAASSQAPCAGRLLTAAPLLSSHWIFQPLHLVLSLHPPPPPVALPPRGGIFFTFPLAGEQNFCYDLVCLEKRKALCPRSSRAQNKEN